MNLDNALTSLFTWQTLLFCLGIYVLTIVIRRGVEFGWKPAAGTPWWRDLLLPSLPMILGLAAALMMKNYPYPAGIVKAGSRMFFGGVCGFFSSWVYRVVKQFFQKSSGPGPDPTDQSGGPLV